MAKKKRKFWINILKKIRMGINDKNETNFKGNGKDDKNKRSN